MLFSRNMLDALIIPRTRELGDGFHVRRALPAMERRSVGPFVFFDQMGPVPLRNGSALDVRPHPHIGLATVTYLFEGEILHRDSLGTVQGIRPGDVNWMTAGRGIVHSERTPAELRGIESRISGIQTWVGLPREHEEAEPGFLHVGRDELPMLGEKNFQVRLILGEWRRARSPVPTLSPMFYADAALEAGAELPMDFEYEERAAYIVEGAIEYEGKGFDAGQMLVFRPAQEVVLRARVKTRLLALGGEPLGQRFIWWNFVSSSKERIAEAAADWKAGRFAAVPGETEFIPLPDSEL